MSDFVAYEVVFKVNAGGTYEALLKYWIKSAADERKLRQSQFGLEHDWRKKFAPVNKVPKEGSGAAQRAGPLRQLAQGPSSTPLLKNGTWATGAAQKNQKVKLELVLSQMREVIADLAETLTELDNQLAPYWCATNSAKASIRATHDILANGMLQFTSSTAIDRKPMFDQLLALAKQWGPIKKERAELNTRVKGYEREAKRIETELTALRRKERARQI